MSPPSGKDIPAESVAQPQSQRHAGAAAAHHQTVPVPESLRAIVQPHAMNASSSSTVPGASPPAPSGSAAKAGTKRSAPITTLPPLDRSGRNLSEKKIRRLEKNRLSARECRRKKKEAALNMEREINLLEAENLRLRLQLQVSGMLIRGNPYVLP